MDSVSGILLTLLPLAAAMAEQTEHPLAVLEAEPAAEATLDQVELVTVLAAAGGPGVPLKTPGETEEADMLSARLFSCHLSLI